ncbi:MAG TPA: response regulator [Thioploca sp.]|nr:response regulator [Thioploca sp.]
MITMEEDQQKGYAMGATDCIDKTTVHSQLAAILEKYHIGDNSTDLVMVVDDDKITRESLTGLLESQNWRVFQAENGQIALEHLENKKPALILLDLNMPVMDGFEFIAHLQQHEKWRSIPVMVLTARKLNAEEQAHLNQHTETIFKKEAYNQEELIQHLHQLITDSSTGTLVGVQSFSFGSARGGAPGYINLAPLGL